MLMKPAKIESRYWQDYGNRISVELLNDEMLFVDPDGVTKLPYTAISDIKLDIKWRHLKAIHLQTKSGNCQLIEGYEKLDEMVHLFREKFPELAKNK